VELERKAQDAEVVFNSVIMQTFRQLSQAEWHK
jgi:hypothetical protein